MRTFFVTSSGTDIGKTLVMTTLCWQLRQAGKKVTALKPVVSGFAADDPGNDTSLILKSCGLTPTESMIDTISPWRFAAPMSPNMAAARDKKTIELSEVVKFCRGHDTVQTDLLLVEGSGGVMTPISERHTILDVIQELGCPAILVTGTYLGALSHTLTAIEALRARGVPLHALVVNESASSTVSMAATVATLEKLLPDTLPVVKIPRIIAKTELWKHAPLIKWICDNDG